MQPRRPGFPARIAPPSEVRKATSPVAGARPATGVGAIPVPSGLGLDSAAVRARMVQRLVSGGVSAPAVLAAMGGVERHRFVDSGLVNQAYEDTSLPIGLGQTISKPSIVARMAELLLGAEIVRTTGALGRVLEIGTGCGYQAAVRGLHEKARANLRPLRLANVHLLLGDGMEGFAKGAPYAGIVAAAGGAELPQAWCDQLAVGGRLVAPIARSDGQQVLLVVDRTVHGLKQTVLEPVHFVPLKSGVA